MQVNNTSLMDGMGEFQAVYWMSFNRKFCVQWDRQTESFNVWCTDEQCAGKVNVAQYVYVLTKQPVLVAKETLAWTRGGREDALSIDSRWNFHIGLYSKRRVNAAGEGGMMRHPPCQQLGRHLTFKAVLMTLPSDWPVDPVHDFFKYQGSRMWSTCRSAFDHYWLPPQESGQLWRLARPKWGGETPDINIFGQSIATSHGLTPNGGLVREISLFQGNLGWWNIKIWPDIYIYIYFFIRSNEISCNMIWRCENYDIA